MKYPTGQIPISVNDQILYCRTDIGGIYRSINNGTNWTYISNYYDINQTYHYDIPPSFLSVQGMVVFPNPQNNAFQTIIACCGNDLNDAESEYFKGLRLSTNNGLTWKTPSVIGGGVWFRGNDFNAKIGGECIALDPNNTEVLYMGGYPIPGQLSKLFKSLDYGENWDILSTFPGMQLESINSIAMHSGSQHIWVGTSHGVIYSTNNGGSWTRMSNVPWVRRIILKPNGINGQMTALVTYGNTNTNGIGRFVSTNGTSWSWDDRTYAFYNDNNSNFSIINSSLFSALTFLDNNETVIIGGKYERPIRKSTNLGTNWTGEINYGLGYGLEITFPYIQNYSFWPKHQIYSEMQNFAYGGMSNITKNPNTGFENAW